MNAEQIVRALRTESLYKDKATLEIMDLCMDAAAMIEALQGELAESRRREKAADKCSDCAYRGTTGCHCARATWRGPCEAGED